MASSIKQIAQICRVSQPTVSKALSGRPGVGKDTRKRIRDVAQQLNYVSNALVHGMQRGRTMSIGVGCNGLSSAFGAGLLSAVLRCLYENGRQALTFDWDQEMGKGERAIRSLAERRVDGLILFPPAHLPPSDYLSALSQLACPIVIVDQHCDQLPFDFIGSDDVSGMSQIVSHLYDELGIDKIACLHYPHVSTGRERRAALLEELVRRGCRFPKDWDREISLDPQSVLRACKQMLKNEKLAPRAIVCFNDEVAAMALAAAGELGRRVPEDVAIVGYGDLPIAHFVRPALTTVVQPVEDIGRRAVELLLQRGQQMREDSFAENDSKLFNPQHIRVPVKLMQRASTLGNKAVPWQTVFAAGENTSQDSIVKSQALCLQPLGV